MGLDDKLKDLGEVAATTVASGALALGPYAPVVGLAAVQQRNDAEKRAKRPHFGVPSAERHYEANQLNLCHLCGDPLASGDNQRVYVFLNIPIATPDGEPLDLLGLKAICKISEDGQPLQVWPEALLSGGIQHERCARLTATWCPVMRKGFSPEGHVGEDGSRGRYYVVSTPLNEWLYAPRHPETFEPLRILNIVHEDWLIEAAVNGAAPKPSEVTTFDGEFPKGLPRPLFEGQPVPFNTSLHDEVAA